ncbi:hypothetical protein ASJ81_04395 [Methanosarcina spelaei]|uniref:Uncharacterized protein n=1 Tax=Methanosarcina spelaei TaxID=1036679 RepID=A0A2A2HTZ1_9EURY|nr:hypothetical protein [Methanosarcina spelaei]PAV12971.1 hypothetical protein ASJ81_04395 [Methanosarcina spelaei]
MPEHQNIKQSRGTQSSQRQIIPAKQVHASNSTAIIQRARIDPKSLTSADVLQLQHTIGNGAVGRLLSEIRNSSTVQQVPVQRQEISEEESLQGMFGSKHNQATCPSCFATPIIQRQELEGEKPLQCMMRRSGQNRPTGLSSTLKARSPFKSPLPEKKQKQESQEKESQELPSQEQELQEQSQKPLRQIEYGVDISQNVVSERKRVNDYCPCNNYAVAEAGDSVPKSSDFRIF